MEAIKKQPIAEWNSEWRQGYKPRTHYWEEFYAAEQVGCDAIRERFDRALEESDGDAVGITELALVLMHKVDAYHGVNEEYARLYTRLWKKADIHACKTLGNAEMAYYLRMAG